MGMKKKIALLMILAAVFIYGFGSVIETYDITYAASVSATAPASNNNGVSFIKSTIQKYGASVTPTLKTSASKTDIKVKWSGIKKSKIKGAQIKYATSNSLKGAKTIKLNKTKAKKMSYSFTTASKKIVKGSTYYFKVRVKVGKKWTKWSSVKSAKLSSKSKKDDDPEDEKEETEEEKIAKLKETYKCTHTLAAGETSEIIVIGDSKNPLILDVHTYADDGTGLNKLFLAYNKNISTPKLPDVLIDMSKVSFVLSDGVTAGEKWDWLPGDCQGFDGGTYGYIYSIPTYSTAMADVYLYPASGICLYEETVPHNYDGSYKVTLYYDGVEIGSQTREKKACINKAIKLFQDYGGEEYVSSFEGTPLNMLYEGESITKVTKARAIDKWQEDTFNYYGCQNGTILENMIYRYYTGEHTAVAEESPLDDVLKAQSHGAIYNATLDYTLPNWENHMTKKIAYALRYKQHGRFQLSFMHVYGLQYNTEYSVWEYNAKTGSGTAPGKKDMPGWDTQPVKDPDFYTPVYE